MLEAAAFLGVLAAGLLAGVISGLFGVGGGILMVPAALYLVPGTTFHAAKAVSLLVILGSASVGIWTHHRHKSVDFRHGALLATGGIAGAALSAMYVERLADHTLTALFGIVLAATGVRVFRPRTTAPRALQPRVRNLSLVGLGLVAGILAGAFGVGGGIVMVPGMVLAGITIHMAVGTSLVAVLSNALGGTTAHLALGYGPTLLTLGVPLALGAIPGTFLGSKLAHRIHPERLQRLFAAGLILTGTWMLLDALLL